MREIPPAIRRLLPDLAWALPLALAGGLAPLLLRHSLDLLYPAGSDPSLWVLTPLDILAGRPTAVMPGFPALVAVGHGVLGLDRIGTATGLVLAAMPLVGPAAYALARAAGATRPWAAVAGVLVLGHPAVACFGVQLQPDAPALVVFALALALGCASLKRGARGSAGLLVGAAIAALLVREQGVLLLPALLLAAVKMPGTPPRRVLRVLLIVGVPLLLIGLQPYRELPRPELPLLARIWEPVGDVLSAERPPFWQEFGRDGFSARLHRGPLLPRLWFYGNHVLRQFPALWAWIGLGLVLGLAGRRREQRWLALALAPFLVGLLVLVKERHLAVILPVAVASWAVSVSSIRRRWLAGGVAAAGIACFAWTLTGWPQRARDMQQQAFQTHQLSWFGSELCRQLEPGAVAGNDESQALMYCPLPKVHWSQGSPLEWKVVWFGPGSPDHEGWGEVELASPLYSVYRLRPDLRGENRPCHGSLPAPGAPYVAFVRQQGWILEPPCEP